MIVPAVAARPRQSDSHCLAVVAGPLSNIQPCFAQRLVYISLTLEESR